MRQTLGFIAVWCGATALAIWVAWFGVRDVLRSQVFDDVKIEPLGAAFTGIRSAPLPRGAPTGPPDLGTPTAASSPRSSPPPSSSQKERTPDPHATPASSTRRTAQPQPVHPPGETTRAPVRTRSSTVPDSVPTRATPVPRTAGSPSPSSTPRATRSSAEPRSAVQAANENVRVVTAKGGSVSFVLENGTCRLVTAAPNAGYEAKVAQNTGWIRVDLVQGEHGSSVFCIGGENRTDLWEY
ncbi:hypothetical protein [Streptosporangium lutulentum]|uniref:Cytoskeletal protein RodZ n=1 Tax=Streptosporangium lutulentum TaxID=1461250 RepID=A0ABT9QW07_9ACTN|nr:hypothetical protein [Streptosporangium lutulentum]MDP9850219.1 cytoskeletal protein RodZ [Streptosporangium lutulentum]